MINQATAASAYNSMSAALEGNAPSAPADWAEGFAAIFDTTDNQVTALAEGNTDMQSVVEAIATTEMALQTAITVRDRIVGAYQEMLRMPL